ncbi:MAG TPA: winged helix-turn-helix domain-containing protein [Acidimicrobiales bacterium]|nr:winged helix-turn-helix domain-containing protein [Acidimicrobiales bacterium]
MEVVLLRWPAEAGTRNRLSVTGEARLLLIEADEAPPTVVDCLEDWIRVPAPEEDVRARVDALTVRCQAHEHSAPGIDDDGVLRFRGRWASLPPLEARLTEALLQRFGAVVGRETLIRAVWPGGSPGRNALDVHVLRLRRRLAPLGLAVRTVRSRGYLLEASAPAAGTGLLSTEGAAQPAT